MRTPAARVACVLAGLLLLAALAVLPSAAQTSSSQVIVYSASAGGTPHLWLMTIEGGAARQLTASRYGEETPSWSPDGRQLVYAQTRRVRVPGLAAPQITPVIVIRDMAHGSVRAITNGRDFDETPAWSPRGDRIAFARTVVPGGTATAYSEIWTVAPSGRGARQLTRNSVADLAPAWSPSASLIAFQRARAAGSDSWDLWVMRADGGRQRRIARDGTRPAWSPDGRSIAFGQPTGQVRGCCQVTNLMVVDANGGHRRLLVRNGGRPAWSPDGARILFQRLSGTRSHLWIVNADGSGLRQLTGPPGDQYAAAWRPG